MLFIKTGRLRVRSLACASPVAEFELPKPPIRMLLVRVPAVDHTGRRHSRYAVLKNVAHTPRDAKVSRKNLSGPR